MKLSGDRQKLKRGIMNLAEYLKSKKKVVDNALKDIIEEYAPLVSRLVESMRYSLMAGGKRLRPILCMAGATAVGANDNDVLPVACALELIHTYSLIHDDLPVMDNDDLRRGKPTNHKVFGDAIAVLAGDALLTEAFHLITSDWARDKVSDSALLDALSLISRAAGYRGMVGGQAADILSEGKNLDLSAVKFIHTHKTGALIMASVTSGAILGNGSNDQIQAIAEYGQNAGLAFQIADDILNIEGDSKTMGKNVGSDEERGKMTYPEVAGLEKSKEIQSKLVDKAVNALRDFDKSADPLRLIVHYIIERHK